MGLLQGISGYTDHACLESSSVKKGKLFSVEEFISWLGQFKASIVTTIEIILIIERFRKLDNVWHMFFFCRLLFILSSTQNLWFYAIFFHKNYFAQFLSAHFLI